MNAPETAPPAQLLIAEYVAPIAGPIIRGGAVAFADGIIRAVGTGASLLREFPDAVITDIGPAVLLPGLVNPHVHLELGNLSCAQSPGRFVDWLMGLAPAAPLASEQIARATQGAIDEGVRQCLRFGVTTAGDISRLAPITRPLLKRSPLRVVSFGEVLAMAQRRNLLDERLAIAVDSSNQTDRLRVGITPHAPYSVEAEGFGRCLAAARAHSMPLATHLAESPDESEFLADQTGPFRELWNALGAWDSAVPRFAGGPIRFAKSLGLLDYSTLLAHVNYCDDDELALLAGGRASVIYCPRTHAYFRHPSHRWRDMLAAGINVAVGTDSTASSPDLNLVDDLRLLRRLAPQIPAQTLWELATTGAARALGLEQQIGSLAPGKAADFIAFPIVNDDPLAAVLEADVLPSQVWVAGRLHRAASS